MTKQTRRDNAAKKAEAAYGDILDEARKIAASKQQDRAAWARPKGTSDHEWDVACAVRVMREQGMAWWQLAHALGLPGSADNVKDGKSGAGYARRLYCKIWGTLPEGVRASSKGSAERRHAAVGPWFSEADEDEYVVAKVRRAEIEWSSRIKASTDVSIVGDNPTIVPARDGRERVLRFNSVVYGEVEGKSKGWMPGPERHVLVSSIMAVRPGVPAGVRLK
jgi:hypothetical protein